MFHFCVFFVLPKKNGRGALAPGRYIVDESGSQISTILRPAAGKIQLWSLCREGPEIKLAETCTYRLLEMQKT